MSPCPNVRDRDLRDHLGRSQTLFQSRSIRGCRAVSCVECAGAPRNFGEGIAAAAAAHPALLVAIVNRCQATSGIDPSAISGTDPLRLARLSKPRASAPINSARHDDRNHSFRRLATARSIDCDQDDGAVRRICRSQCSRLATQQEGPARAAECPDSRRSGVRGGRDGRSAAHFIAPMGGLPSTAVLSSRAAHGWLSCLATRSRRIAANRRNAPRSTARSCGAAERFHRDIKSPRGLDEAGFKNSLPAIGSHNGRDSCRSG